MNKKVLRNFLIQFYACIKNNTKPFVVEVTKGVSALTGTLIYYLYPPQLIRVVSGNSFKQLTIILLEKRVRAVKGG